ncbi:MAG: fasciclin domain-containing protein [Caldilineaceae bacterium]|nr:fasciclin domain-containing protein [Caldilineaceae bacterium]
MKRYLLFPCFFFSLALMGACMVSPLSTTEEPAVATSATEQSLAPTFTATTAVITPTATLTTTAVITAMPTLTDSTPVTAAMVTTATPILTATSVVTTPVSDSTPLPTEPSTIATLLNARPEFSTLAGAVATVQLTTELNGDVPYTLLAPTNAAFAKLPSDTVAALLASPTALTSLLQNHLLIEEAASDRLVRLGTVLSALGQTLPVTLTVNGVVQVGDANVVEPDIEATNGVIHAIDTVLLPADLVIPPLVTPTSAVTTTAPVTAAQAVTTVAIVTTIAPTATLTDIIRETPELEMAESALGAAGLLQALQLPGQLTLFVPTNAAFEALPADQLQSLLNTTGDIANVMRYHVVADDVSAADLVRLGSALATSGQTLTITTADDGRVLVNNARIIQADIVATNGVIHMIDAVLLPVAE